MLAYTISKLPHLGSVRLKRAFRTAQECSHWGGSPVAISTVIVENTKLEMEDPEMSMPSGQLSKSSSSASSSYRFPHIVLRCPLCPRRYLCRETCLPLWEAVPTSMSKESTDLIATWRLNSPVDNVSQSETWRARA